MVARNHCEATQCSGLCQGAVGATLGGHRGYRPRYRHPALRACMPLSRVAHRLSLEIDVLRIDA
jgi:hypothetical protein